MRLGRCGVRGEERNWTGGAAFDPRAPALRAPADRSARKPRGRRWTQGCGMPGQKGLLLTCGPLPRCPSAGWLWAALEYSLQRTQAKRQESSLLNNFLSPPFLPPSRSVFSSPFLTAGEAAVSRTCYLPQPSCCYSGMSPHPGPPFSQFPNPASRHPYFQLSRPLPTWWLGGPRQTPPPSPQALWSEGWEGGVFLHKGTFLPSRIPRVAGAAWQEGGSGALLQTSHRQL